MTKAELEKMIAQLLRDYELQTNEVVREISLHTIDATTYESENTELLQAVVVTTERMPGNSWLC